MVFAILIADSVVPLLLPNLMTFSAHRTKDEEMGETATLKSLLISYTNGGE